jgi:hypothetical protein
MSVPKSEKAKYWAWPPAIRPGVLESAEITGSGGFRHKTREQLETPANSTDQAGLHDYELHT